MFVLVRPSEGRESTFLAEGVRFSDGSIVLNADVLIRQILAFGSEASYREWLTARFPDAVESVPAVL
jgi:hypothetical protein